MIKLEPDVLNRPLVSSPLTGPARPMFGPLSAPQTTNLTDHHLLLKTPTIPLSSPPQRFCLSVCLMSPRPHLSVFLINIRFFFMLVNYFLISLRVN